MSLEDGIADVVAKAMMGLGIEAGSLAEKTGVALSRIEAVLEGDFDEASLREIASALGLGPAALVSLPGYLPQKQEIPGVRRIELPFGQWTVNAWMIEHGGFRLLFDTGCNGNDITRALGGTLPDAVFITHAHGDHVGGIAAFASAGIRVISETEALEASTFDFPDISIRVVDLSGHMTPTAGYIIGGFGKRVLVPGDAIFAGSIGRCRSPGSYRMALDNLNRVLGEVGEDCVILPGHGPATTVAEELVANPFLGNMAADFIRHADPIP